MTSQMAYRVASVQGASGLGILISLFDRLISDLNSAAEAQRAGNLELRCSRANHAVLVLGFLENWIGEETRGDLADHLLALYAAVRSSILQAQIRQSADLMTSLVPYLIELNQIWHGREKRQVSETGEVSNPSYPMQEKEFIGSRSSIWSA